MKHLLLTLTLIPFCMSAGWMPNPDLTCGREGQTQISKFDAELLHMKGQSTIITKEATDNKKTYIYVDTTTDLHPALQSKIICTKDKSSGAFTAQFYDCRGQKDTLLSENEKIAKRAYNALKALHILKEIDATSEIQAKL